MICAGDVGMKKIGILGGTFNPIHHGHLIIAETARNVYGLDKVLLIPSGCSYMKDPKTILPGPQRFLLTRLAAEDHPFLEASSVEVERGGNSYTVDTLRELKKFYPDAVFFYIVGADTIFQMESWKDPDEIFESCVTVVSVRDGFRDERLKQQIAALAKKYRADIRLMPSLHIEISSTDIRNRCKKAQSIRYLVPEPVRIFLEENGCYR